MTYYLFTDGSYNPHLHISSMGGYVVDENKNVIFEFSEKLTEESLLKYHELAAFKLGLEKCIEHKIKNIVCYSDDISLRNLNYLEVLERPNVSPAKKGLIENIIQLRKEFDVIDIKHIRRKFNKKADKLAERIQLEHFYDNIFFKERYEIESQKFLRVPNLLCLEDLYSKDSSEESILKFQEEIEQKFLLSDIYFILKLDTIDEDNGIANIYSIDTKTQQKTVIDFREFDIKKVNSHCIDLLECVFKTINIQPKPSLGFIIESENLALKKFDMLLRKRFIFPKVKTPLADRFLNSCNNFSQIVLIDYLPDTFELKKTIKNKI